MQDQILNQEAAQATAGMTEAPAPATATVTTTVPPTETSQQTENQPASPQGIQVSPEEFALLQRLKQEQRQWQIDKRISDMGNDFTTRRNSLLVRRALKFYPELVKPVEVLAYTDLYKMREADLGPRKKVHVSDEEISAFLALEAQGADPTLQAVETYCKQN